MKTASWLLCLALASAGCFKYTYVSVAEAPVGREVRVHLSPEGLARLTTAVGDQLPDLRRTFDGSLVQVNAQQLLVSVRLTTDARIASAGLMQRVAVPVGDVQQLELKQLDRRKVTLISVGAGAVLAALIAHYVGGIFGGTTGTIPEPGQPETIIPRARPAP
ncbi:MAG: hypothetical protein ACT4P7_16885 [Gemmatimonadaceae bacterium]